MKSLNEQNTQCYLQFDMPIHSASAPYKLANLISDRVPTTYIYMYMLYEQ